MAAQASPTATITRLVNQIRASHGLTPYEYNSTLAVAAQNHANWMAANAVYSHTGAGGSTPLSRAQAAGYAGYVSENIVGGTDLTPSQGVTWWQNSPVHFNTMISPRYTHIGVGYASGHDQNFYVMVVGNPSNRPPASLARETADKADVPFLVTPIELSQPREDGSIVHTVQPGQTLWAIAARYEISMEDLFLFNNLTEDEVLQPGDELTIRLAEGQPPPPTPTPPTTHVVRRGETAWTIAARYKISLEDIFWLNNLTEDSFLQPGDEITIRLAQGQTPPPTPTPQISHIVESGETAWSIAVRYGLTLDQLLTFNGMEQNAMLYPGDELLIVPPTPLPTATAAPATDTPTAGTATDDTAPSLTPTPASLATATATLTPAPSSTASPAASEPDFGRALFVGTTILGVGLTALAAVVTLLLRRQL